MRANLDAGPFVISGGGYRPPGQPAHQTARRTDKQRGHSRKHAGFNDRWDQMSRAEQQAKGAQLRSVWWLPTANYAEGHFAVMPEEMAAICILAGCPAGGVVLDPFAGAGTTLLVADRLGRSAIGIELNPDFAAMCERRVREPGFTFADIAAE
jgi:DNA modification methylase